MLDQSKTCRAAGTRGRLAVSHSRPMQLGVLKMALASAFMAMDGMPALADTTISSFVGTLVNSETARLVIFPTGTISGATIGYTNAISTGTLDNRGTIALTGSTVNSFALVNSGTIQSLFNSGVVKGFYAIRTSATGSIGVLTNSGTVTGTAYGVFNGGTINTFNHLAGATLSGGSVDIYSDGRIGTLNNAGLLTGTYSVFQGSGTIGVINNSGTMSVIAGGVVGTLTNSGLIARNVAGTVLSVKGLSTFNNSGTMAGDIFGDATPMTINGGAGTAFGTLTGFGAAVGTITQTLANVIFGSGNLLLNDHINAGGRTVNNAGGTLQVNNPLTITGNYVQNKEATLLLGVANNAVANGAISGAGYGRLVVTGFASLAPGTTIALTRLGTYPFAQGQRFVVLQSTGGALYDPAGLNLSVVGYAGPVTGAHVTDAGKNNLVLTLQEVPAPPVPPAPPDPIITAGVTTKPATTRTVSAPGNWFSFDFDEVTGEAEPGELAPSVTPDASAALSGLLRYEGVDPGMLNVYNAAIALPSVQEANRAGAQLSPVAVNTSAAKSVNTVMDAVTMIAATHLNGLSDAYKGSDGVASGDTADNRSPFALWGQFLGGRATMAQRDNISGYRANYRGLLIGGDGPAGEHVRAGALLSYAKINIANEDFNSGSAADVDSYGAMAYASFTRLPWYGNVMAGVARQRYRTVRAISFPGFDGTANGAFMGQLYTAVLQGGYRLTLPGDSTLTPMAGLAYNILRQNGYTESGGNGAALQVAATSTPSLKSDIGVKWQHVLATAYGQVEPSAQLRWRHEFRDARLRTASTFAADASGTAAFTSVGSAPGRNSALLVLGTSMKPHRHLSMMLNYFLEAASGYTSHSGDVRLVWEF